MNATATKQTPQDRRFAGIRSIVQSTLTDGAYLKPGTTRRSVSEAIGELTSLGRAQWWKGSLEGWQAMVTDKENPLSWAITQGAIFIGLENANH